MLSKADSVDGQDDGSSYLEQVALVKEAEDLFEITEERKNLIFSIFIQ